MEEMFMDECLADVPAEPVPWLWPERIPRGMITILAGLPGEGKSWLTLDIAARVSTGSAWPDGQPAPQGGVILMSAEDVTKFTIRPRLDALGADPRQIYRLQMIRGRSGGKERPFDLTKDLELLEQKIVERRAAVVIIDPLTAYVGKVDSYKDAEVRAVLAPLAALAERYGVAIIGIMHLTKEAARPLIHRLAGSGGFGAAPRAVFFLARDPNDRQRRLFMPAKTSLVVDQPTLTFRLVKDRLVWDPSPLDVDPDDILRGDEERSKLDEAMDFIRTELGGGQALAKAIVTKSRQIGIADITLKRAKRIMGMISLYDGTTGTWSWSIPAPPLPSCDPLIPLTVTTAVVSRKKEDQMIPLHDPLEGMTSLNVRTNGARGSRGSRGSGGSRLIDWNMINEEDEP